MEKKDIIERINVVGECIFITNEDSHITTDELKKLAAEYHSKKSEIADYMLENGISEVYGNISKEKIVESLGRPTIRPDSRQISFCEHTLDEIHILSMEYSEELHKFYYFTIDG